MKKTLVFAAVILLVVSVSSAAVKIPPSHLFQKGKMWITPQIGLYSWGGSIPFGASFETAIASYPLTKRVPTSIGTLACNLSVTAQIPTADAGAGMGTVDFRYSPPEWQTAICLPDDPHKSLVDRSGELLYHYEQGGREFASACRRGGGRQRGVAEAGTAFPACAHRADAPRGRRAGDRGGDVRRHRSAADQRADAGLIDAAHGFGRGESGLGQAVRRA